MKHILQNQKFHFRISLCFMRFAMLARFNKESVFGYQANLDDLIKTNTKFIIIAVILSSLADYMNLFYTHFRFNGWLITCEHYNLFLALIFITFNKICMGLWLIFIKNLYQILSILAEIGSILLSLTIFINHVMIGFAHLNSVKCETIGFEFLFLGLSILMRVSIANIFIRYGLFRLFYCFSLIFILIFISLFSKVQEYQNLYGYGIFFLFYLSFLLFLIEKVKLKNFEEKYKLEQNDKTFKEIMTHIPENILIIGKNGNLKYANIDFKNYFKITDEKLFSFLERLYNIKEIKQQSSGNDTPKINKINIEEKNSIEIPLELDFSDNNQNTPKCNEDQKRYKTLNEVIEYLLYDQEYMSNLNKLFIFHGFYKAGNHLESLRTFEIKIKPNAIEEEPYLIIILRDITEREIIAFLEESNEYKNDLIASFSHELRTPLNSQINYLEAAINDSTLDNRVKLSYLRPALQSCKLLKHMINDILDLSSINNNNIALELNRLSLESTLLQCMELIEFQAFRKNIKVELEIDSKLPNIVNTDHNKVSQIIVSLLSNSLKYTQENGKIHCVARFNSPNITITISDTGIGMTEDEQARLKERLNFDLKYRRINKKVIDFGIGLPISNILAKLLGPKGGVGLDFESKKNSGTKFSFTILDITENEKKVISLEHNLRETDTRFNVSSQNEFPNINTDHHDIPSLSLIQTSNKFISRNLFSSPKITINKDLENKPIAGKYLIDEEIDLIGTNRNFNSTDHKDISIISSKSHEIMHTPMNSHKYLRISKKDIYNNDNFRNNIPIKSIICDDDITYDKNKLGYKYKKNEQKNESFFNYILPDLWKRQKFSHENNKTIHNDHDFEIKKNFDNDLNNPHSENMSKIKTKSHLPHKKCTCPEILIVDDNSFNILSMECLLKQLKYTYSSAFNGQLAIDQVIQRESNKCSPSCEQYKLILMDFSMPIMNGIEATKILKEKMKCGLIRPIRIIACTAFASIDKRKEYIEAGMDGFMSKPIDIVKLKDILRYQQLKLKK